MRTRQKRWRDDPSPQGKQKEESSPEMEVSDASATPGEDQELFVLSSPESRSILLGTNQVPDKDGK
jgi:hypothetical protein